MAALIKKLLFLATRRIVLADRVRNFAYQWAWRRIRSHVKAGRICNIGSRDSLFPAFLAWRGYSVTAGDIDPCGEYFAGIGPADFTLERRSLTSSISRLPTHRQGADFRCPLQK